MQRNFSKLSSGGKFDVLIIGGGITGAWAAYDAARRGLHVALVEKSDWASGTSSASSKMIHGGLRYLATYEFGLVKHSLEERALLARLAPHLIRPVRFALPIYKTDDVTRLQMKAGLTMYDWFATRKSPAPKHEYLSKKKYAKRYPYIRQEGLVGGFTYGDCQEDDARMTVEIVWGADFTGATCVNHCRATELLREGEKVVGATLRDELTGEETDVYARTVVNAAGPWCESLLPSGGKSRLTRLVKGVHLMMPSLPLQKHGYADGMLITNPDDGRVVFLIPWYGYTILGTTDSDYEGSPDALGVTVEEEDYLLDIANKALAQVPGAKHWQRKDICGSYAGVRTLENAEGKSASKVSREWALTEPLPNMLMPIGGKYTTAREDASFIVDKVVKKLGVEAPECTTGKRPFPWAPLAGGAEGYKAWEKQAIADLEKAGVEAAIAKTVARRQGNQLPVLLDLIAADASLAERVDPAAPFIKAEAKKAKLYEMAVSDEDVYRRRMPLTLLTAGSSNA
ncbi:MAG: glycerol-3-phosphate dehydrogenase/oxidase [Gammaproteobacteria bacterium]|nr:glycerol-3-phosphate dehydrogenase/oxidase [Gammaproteobacteria bacterium]